MSAIEDRRQEINKKRWERWRAQQNVEREKTYCYWGEWSDHCDCQNQNVVGDYVLISAYADFDRNRVDVYWRYELCHCLAGLASMGPWGTLTITIDYCGSGGPSKSHTIDYVFGDDGWDYFTGLNESNCYGASCYLDAYYKCCGPEHCDRITFKHGCGCTMHP
ncbi:MAG TPA: hypothetical protein ENN68_03380 [Methanomicrobia archaeon]|nr:hypothetical protein [Methanomicrobia archaeon]